MKYQKLLLEAVSKKKVIADLFKKLKSLSDKELDMFFHDAHFEVFEEINCLDCANCCKTIGPTINNVDVNRMSIFLKIKPGVLADKYLICEKDGTYSFKSESCPFLGQDNYCSIYSARPIACREYPHTNRRRMHQILELTRKNCFVCPAVYKIIESAEGIS